MTQSPNIVVLYGGNGPEREIALKSGKSVAKAIEDVHAVEAIDLNEPKIPSHLDPEACIVFPVFHGDFGENGILQGLLEEAGFSYVGSGPEASHLCMNKHEAKALLRSSQVSMLPDLFFDASEETPSASSVMRVLGNHLVIKPSHSGSTIGLMIAKGKEEIQSCLKSCKDGVWLIEPYQAGRDLTVGILEGKPLEVIEMIPESGFYDFEHKYSPGMTRYECPASISDSLKSHLLQTAREAFLSCGCRDYGRVDFILTDSGKPYFLEVNTIPGLSNSETSLFPRCARVASDLNYQALIHRLLKPALRRFQERNPDHKTILNLARGILSSQPIVAH